MRITMGAIMRQYNSQLSTLMREKSRASTRAVTGRLYERASEDPTRAVRAGQVSRQLAKTNDYLNNIRDIKGTFDVAESTLSNIENLAEDAYVGLLGALNGTMGEDERKVYAAQLRSIQEQMVMDANYKYSDKYLFGGSSATEPPFKLENGVLTFRGIDVNTTDPTELAELEKIAGESKYIDIGFGLQFDGTSADPNTLVRGTAFDTAFPAIKFLGFGEDTVSGLPNNNITLLGMVADELESPTYSPDNIKPLADQMEKQRKSILVNITDMGSKTMFLEFTEQRLGDAQFNLENRKAEISMIDTEYALMMFEMQKYAYDAALKMGPNVLSNSFIDFMR